MLAKVELGKQAADLCTSSLTQQFVDAYFDDGRWPAVHAHRLLILEQVPLRRIEIDVERIERDDGREKRRRRSSSLHEIARRDLCPPHSAGDWRAHNRPLEVELRHAKRGICRARSRRAFGDCTRSRIELFAGDRLRVDEPFGAIELLLGELFMHPRLFEHRFGSSDLGFVGSRIDRDERVAALDDGALVKCEALNETGDAGANVHRLDRLEVSRELVDVRYLTSDRWSDGDFGRLHVGRRLLARRRECEKKAGALECVVPHLRDPGTSALAHGTKKWYRSVTSTMLLTGNTRVKAFVTGR